MAESESFESSESFADSESFGSMSPPAIDQAVVGTAAGQDVSASNDVLVQAKPKRGLFADFNIFNAMLMAALLFILLATFYVFSELAGYGGLDGSWRTGSVGR